MRRYSDREIFFSALAAIFDALPQWIGLACAQVFAFFGLLGAFLSSFFSVSDGGHTTFLLRVHSVNISSYFSNFGTYGSVSSLLVGLVVLFLCTYLLASIWLVGAALALRSIGWERVEFLAEFWKLFLRYSVKAFLLFCVLGGVVLGTTLLGVFPGLYCLVRLQFAPFCLVVHSCSLTESMRISWRMSGGQVIPLLWTLLALASFLGFFISTYWLIWLAFPFMMLVQALLFQALSISRSMIWEAAFVASE